MALNVLLALAGLSQKQLAEASGIDRSTISGYGKGKRPIPDRNRERILDALHVTPSIWGVAEETAKRFVASRERFTEARTADAPYEASEPPGGGVRETLGALESLDPQTAADISEWVGTCVTEALRGVFQRFRDRRD